MDIEKAFDSLDHNFVIPILEKYGCHKKFILWVKILLRDQELCAIINGVKTTKYFSLGKGAYKEDKILTFLFILALEVLFLLIKSKLDIVGMTIFDCNFLYSAYADNKTFFFKDIISVNHTVSTFISYFSGLNQNFKIVACVV